MARATYFLRIDSYWQNSPDRFVGPFSSKDEAATAIEAVPENANVWLSTSTCGGDIRDAVRVYPEPLSKTQARKAGMLDYQYGDYTSNVVGTTIPSSLRQMRTIDEYMAEQV